MRGLLVRAIVAAVGVTGLVVYVTLAGLGIAVRAAAWLAGRPRRAPDVASIASPSVRLFVGLVPSVFAL
jgi:hypothetical protein